MDELNRDFAENQGQQRPRDGEASSTAGTAARLKEQVTHAVLPGFQEQYNKRQNERSHAGGVARRPNGPETDWGATPGSETDYPR